MMERAVPTVFFSYSHCDEALRDQLEKQLAMLKRQGVIDTWHDRRIGAGQEVDQVIDERMSSDEIILLLISPDFIASDYCYDIEMKRALERHNEGSAIVIPVILRACDWHPAPFGKLNASPPDGKPITQWPDKDEAFLHVARAVRAAAERLSPGHKSVQVKAMQDALVQTFEGSTKPAQARAIRSSNLGLTKTFTQRDKDHFLHETFEYVALYFENSLKELEARNPGHEGAYRRVDANRFFSTIYRNGADLARGTIYMGGAFGGGIKYVQGEKTDSGSMNECLTVEADDQSLYLKSFGMASFSTTRGQKLTQEGAAELLWGMLIAPLQQRRF
jgi:hypothetical protein